MKLSKIHRYTFFFLFFIKYYWGQDSALVISAGKIYVDNLGNIYNLQEGVITKYFIDKPQKSFSIKTYGKVESIDVTNALRVLIYFKDFQRVLFLDSQLSQNGQILELTDLGLEQATLVCSSVNNGFWVYNAANNELLRYNKYLQVTVNTGNLKRLLNIDIHPVFMVEHNGKLYLNDPATGILVFDIYGAYLKIIPVLHINAFQIHYPYIFYVYQNKFYSFHLNTFESIEISDIPDNCENIIYNGNFCYWDYNHYIRINRCIK